jgi:hypothetical protein
MRAEQDARRPAAAVADRPEMGEDRFLELCDDVVRRLERVGDVIEANLNRRRARLGAEVDRLRAIVREQR